MKKLPARGGKPKRSGFMIGAQIYGDEPMQIGGKAIESARNLLGEGAKCEG